LTISLPHARIAALAERLEVALQAAGRLVVVVEVLAYCLVELLAVVECGQAVVEQRLEVLSEAHA
jgi:hypothetical protein